MAHEPADRSPSHPPRVGEHPKKTVAIEAVEECIARRRHEHLLDLIGRLEWDSSYDYKTERTRGKARSDVSDV